MISQIHLKHFKCFTDIIFQLGRITLLTGQNASGKSTVMQAIGLLNQTMREHEWSTRLILNGGTVGLGTIGDVLDQASQGADLEIGVLDAEDDLYRWTFGGGREELSMAIQSAMCSIGDSKEWEYKEGETLRYLLPLTMESSNFARRFREAAYLSAKRVAPQEAYVHHDPQTTATVGARGENAVSILSTFSDQNVLDPLVKKESHPLLLQQVIARMALFFPGCELSVEEVKMASGLILGIRSSATTGYHRPANTGLGITQVLPIVVAALSARENDLLLIENPEVHLHPAGQSKVGYFLAEVAAAGVQVVLETHSDHVLNGVLKAVKDKCLSGDDAIIYYFQERGQLDGRASQVIQPLVNDQGKIDDWPKGFFDQIDKDLGYLIGWGEE